MVRTSSSLSSSSSPAVRVEALEPRTLLSLATTSTEFDNPLIHVNNYTLFDVSVGVERRELWSFDGVHSARLLTESINGPGTSFVAMGNQAYFSNEDFSTGKWALYKTDGTPAGTTAVRDLGLNNESGDMILAMAASGTKLYFIADPSAGNGADLWVSDGTAAGTQLLHHFAGYYPPTDLTTGANSSIYFAADDSSDNIDVTVWKSDGTSGGTVPLSRDQGAFGIPSPVESLINWNGAAVWIGSDAANSHYGVIWFNDGDGQGGQDDQVLQADGVNPIENVTNLFVANGKLFFAAGDQDSTDVTAGVFVMNSPTDTPHLVQSLPEGSVDGIVPVAAYNGRFLYINQGELDSTDGNTVTALATVDTPGQEVYLTTSSDPGVQNAWFFLVDGYENLWRTDGVTAGNTGQFPQSTSEIDPLVALPDGSAFYVADGQCYRTSGQQVMVQSPITALAAPPTPIGSCTIAGNVFDDPNANGKRDAGEKPLPGYKVFIDLYHDGVCHKKDPWTRASSTGRYTFSNLLPDNYTVRIVGVEGRRPSTADLYTVKFFVDGSTAIRHFGRSTKPLVWGVVYRDNNRNGTPDSGEARLAGWTVYVDVLRSNDILSLGILALTTDAAGKFTLPDTLPAGTYRIRVISKTGYRLTSPAAGYRWATIAPGMLTKTTFGERRI